MVLIWPVLRVGLALKVFAWETWLLVEVVDEFWCLNPPAPSGPAAPQPANKNNISSNVAKALFFSASAEDPSDKYRHKSASLEVDH